MKKVLKIDSKGYFIEDVLLDENETTPTDCVEVPCQQGFYKPKWDGTHWVEGLTQEEIVSYKPGEEEIIKTELQSLDNVLPRAVEDLIIAIGLDTKKLPKIMQDRLNQKQQLRERLQSI